MYSKNIAALERYAPGAASVIKKLKRHKDYTTQYASNKMPVGCIRGDPIHSLVAPDIAAGEELEASNITTPHLMVFLGMGYCYHIYHYLSQRITGDSLTIIVEPDLLLFNEMLYSVDISPLLSDNDIVLFLGKKIDDLFIPMRELFRRKNVGIYSKSIGVFAVPGTQKYQKEYHKQFMYIMQETLIEEVKSYGNSFEDGNEGIVNILDNLDIILGSPGILQLKDRIDKKPAVIVSAGPSLNKELELLKQHQDKFFVCALDATLKLCLENDIIPDFVFSTERIELTTRFLDNLPDKDLSDVYLASCPVARPELYQKWKGKNIMIYRQFFHFTKWIPIQRGVVHCGSSSANLAYSTMVYIGCDPIILLGQDLCYGDNDCSHASGIKIGTWKRGEKKENDRKIMCNDRQPRNTTANWLTFLRQFEVAIEKNPGKTINTSLKGAKIAGAEVMPFSEAVKPHNSMNTKQILKDLVVYKRDNNEVKEMQQCKKFTKKKKNKILKQLITIIKSNNK